MRMVGTVALDPGRAGPSAVALACDLCVAAVQATEWLRHGVQAVTRGVGAALAARGPVVAALTASFRALSTPWAAVVAAPRAGGTPYVAGFRTDARPPHRTGVPRTQNASWCCLPTRRRPAWHARSCGMRPRSGASTTTSPRTPPW